MIVESCSKGKCVIIHASLGETYFMYMYSTLFSILHFVVPFDKFEVDVLKELNVAPTQLYLNSLVTIYALRVLCDLFFIILTAPKFLHYYIVKENKKVMWSSVPIPPLIRILRVTFFERVLESGCYKFTLLCKGKLNFLSTGLHHLRSSFKKLVVYLYDLDQEDMVVLHKFPRGL